jgi:hypothetical protein
MDSRNRHLINPLTQGNNYMHENAFMRYSESIGSATEMATQDKLSPTLIVACLTRFIDVVVRCADDDDFKPNWRSPPLDGM